MTSADRAVTFGDLLRCSAGRFPDRVAVVHEGREVTHRELDELSSRFAHHIRETVPRGSHVATVCANSAEFLTVIYAISKAGAVWVPVNPALPPDEIAFVLDHAEVAMVVVDERLAGEVGGDLPLTLLSSSLHTTVAHHPAEPPEAGVTGDQLALIMYTSGTTARPKGVMHSHSSVRSAVIANVTTMEFTERDRLSGMLPLFHCAQHVMSTAVIAAGGGVVLSNGFSPDIALDMIARHEVTVFGGLPAMFAAALASPRASTVDFSSVRLAVYAMAPMPRAMIENIATVMDCDVWLITGQTEAYPITMRFRALGFPHLDANYWGEPTSLCETRVMNEDGTFAAPGKPGEIVHRGPNVMLGYFKDPEATAEAQRFGWHHTGDVGVIGEDGQLLFLDRLKDMIKSGGENVASVKVEAVLLAHPGVTAAAVIGVPDPRWGEAVLAVVVATAGRDELLGHCRDRLARFEVPKEVVVVESLPTTATGKVQKARLRAIHVPRQG